MIARAAGMVAGLVAVAAGLDAAERPAPAASFYESHIQPIFDQACVGCHGLERTRGGLQLQSFEALQEGGDSGAAIAPGAAERSELYRRLTLPPDHEEAMPPEGKTRLSAAQTEILRRWLEAGAPGVGAAPAVVVADLEPEGPRERAPDYRPFAAQLAALQAALPVRFVPVSEQPTDGLILRTISQADRVDDGVMAQLAPVAALIVDAELARTRVTDGGLAAVGRMVNLRRLDLARTRVSSRGIARLGGLTRLEAINLVDTAADAAAWDTLSRLPALRRIHVHGTSMGPKPAPAGE